MGHLLALHVTPANESDRTAVAALAEAVQEATGESVSLAYVDQGYTGEKAEAAAAGHGIRLEVVKLADARRGFALLPRRWVVERSFVALSQARPPLRAMARNHRRHAPARICYADAQTSRCPGSSP